MNRTGWAAALAAVLGIALAGVIGYMVWHSAGHSYQAVETQTAAGEAGRAGSGGQEGANAAPGGENEAFGNTGFGGGGDKAADGDGIGVNQTGDDSSLGHGDPAEAAESETAEPEDDTVRLVFGGDVLFSDHVLNAYSKTGDITGVLDDGLREVIGGSDLFMVNQEFPFSSRGTAAADKQYTFRLKRYPF